MIKGLLASEDFSQNKLYIKKHSIQTIYLLYKSSKVNNLFDLFLQVILMPRIQGSNSLKGIYPLEYPNSIRPKDLLELLPSGTQSS